MAASYRSPRPSPLGSHRLLNLHNISGLTAQLQSDAGKFSKQEEDDTLCLSELIGRNEQAEA